MTTTTLDSALIAFDNALLALDQIHFTDDSLVQAWGGPYTFSQISTAQIVVATQDGQGGFLVIDGSGLQVPIGSVLSGAVPAITPANIGGTVSTIDLYQGGSLQGTTVSNGTLALAATFTESQWQITDGSLQLTIAGNQLPTSAAAIDSILFGSYSGAAIDISSLTLAYNGQYSLTYTPEAETLTLNVGD